MRLRRHVRVGMAAAVLGTVALGVGPSFGSSHREAPLTAADPQIDSTDLYAFSSPDATDTVTLISNWIPFQEPAGGPNFYRWAERVRYNVHVDNDGDAKPDLTYLWQFKTHVRNGNTFLMNTGPVTKLTDETLNVYQTYTLTEIKENAGAGRVLVKDGIVAPSNVGKASMPDYASLRRRAVTELSTGGGKSFVGQADDPFFLDLRVFDLLYGTDLSEAGNDTLDGYNINTIALQIPKRVLAAGGDPGKNSIIGVWTTAERPTIRTQSTTGSQKFSGPWVQVSRLGQPLVNEVVAPVAAKDLFSGSKPENDAQFLKAVQDPEVPKLLQAIYKIKAPAAPRNDLVQVFLTGVKGLNQPVKFTPSEMLRLNMSIPPTRSADRLGVLAKDNAGFPNGRRLTDDVVDIALRAMAGAVQGVKTDLGDGVDKNDVAFETQFPYVALPHSGSEGTAGTAAAAGSRAGGSEVASTRAGGVSTGAAVGIGLGALALGMLIMGMPRRRARSRAIGDTRPEPFRRAG